MQALEFEKALAAKPNAAAPKLGLGKVHFSKGDVAKALDFFQQVAASAPGTPEAAEAETFIKELKKPQEVLWVTDGITQKVLKYDLTGKLLYSWGTFGAFPGGFWGVHQFSVDSEGSLYTADVQVGRP